MYFGQGVRDPKLEVSTVSQKEMKFRLKNTDASMANNIRRSMIAEVPVMAIETVIVHENSSCLFDEFICHRLGLIPLYSEDIGDTPEEAGRSFPGSYNMMKDCDCLEPSGCEYCTVEFELDVHNSQNFTVDVTHFDIMLKHERQDRAYQVTPVPVRDETLSYEEDVRKNGIKILRLGKNQGVKMTLKAMKSTSKSHAKFNPVGTAFYRYIADIRFNSATMTKLAGEDKKGIVDVCPSKVFDWNPDLEEIIVARPEDCTFCDECVHHTKDMGYRFLLTVKQIPDVYDFTVQGIGSRNAPDIVQAALNSYLYRLRISQGNVAQVHDILNRKAIAFEPAKKTTVEDTMDQTKRGAIESTRPEVSGNQLVRSPVENV